MNKQFELFENYTLNVYKENNMWKVSYCFNNENDENVKIIGSGETYEEACDDVIEKTLQWYNNLDNIESSYSEDELIEMIDDLNDEIKEKDYTIEVLKNNNKILHENINAKEEEIASLKEEIANLEEYIDDLHINEKRKNEDDIKNTNNLLNDYFQKIFLDYIKKV